MKWLDWHSTVSFLNPTQNLRIQDTSEKSDLLIYGNLSSESYQITATVYNMNSILHFISS